MSHPLVSANWLHSQLRSDKLVILDATMPPVGFTFEEAEFGCIPGAQFFDIEGEASDQASELPHTLPSPNQFTHYAQSLGINQDSTIVIYDRYGIYSAPRAWWLFKVMGFDNVLVLDGGLPAWRAKHYALDDTYAKSTFAGNFLAVLEPSFVVDKQTVLKSINADKIKIVDARSAGRFAGTEPEPRRGLRGGHIPLSNNIPFNTIINDGHFLSLDQLRKQFENIDVNVDTLCIFSCGSGVTACVVYLAAYLCGYRKLTLYDGSWSEWGGDISLPIHSEQIE